MTEYSVCEIDLVSYRCSSSYAFVGFNDYEEAALAFSDSLTEPDYFGRPLKISFARDSFNDKFPYAENNSMYAQMPAPAPCPEIEIVRCEGFILCCRR